MFLNISPIIVPYVSVIDIYQYLEKMGLAISTTGGYSALYFANDNFNFYASGTDYFVSGSGYWGPGSGSTYTPVDYFYDLWASYSTGFNSGYFNSGNKVVGYNIISPFQYSGLFTSNLNYIYENFAAYPTGLFTQGNLIDGNSISGFFIYFPNNYNGVFNFLNGVKSNYTVTDLANTGIIWTGSGINTNPGAGNSFPYIQLLAPNSLSYKQGGTGSNSYNGPYYGASSGTIPFPWTGGGPILVGNIAINQIVQNQIFYNTSGGYVSSSLNGTGIITGDFTIDIVWNWNQNITASTGTTAVSVTYYTGKNIGYVTGITGGLPDPLSGGAFFSATSQVTVLSGGPGPFSQNYGPYYVPTGVNSQGYVTNQYGGFTFTPTVGTPSYISILNKDFPLLDYDMLSGFAIYYYVSPWSGITWLTQTTNVYAPYSGYGNTINQSPSTQYIYTGISSGLAINPYVFVLGNKISGNLIGPTAISNTIVATGIVAATGFYSGNYIQNQNTGSWTGYGGVTSGFVANGQMAQFTGFGFGIAQYLTLTRSGTTVSLYQSGILFATGYASGQIKTTLPLKIGVYNASTGIYTNQYMPFGLYYFDYCNYAKTQTQIQSGLLIYTPPPQSGLISSTTFVLQ